jgi:hypothetical protein
MDIVHIRGDEKCVAESFFTNSQIFSKIRVFQS